MLRFRTKAIGESHTKTVVKARGFELIIDEPQDLGGTNEGPNPVEFVLAALSGCLNVVGNLIAKEMGFELRGLDIDIVGDLDPAKFMGKTEEGRAGYTEIHVTLKPDTDADQEILKKWAEKVEQRCPVSDNIANATPVKIDIAK